MRNVALAGIITMSKMYQHDHIHDMAHYEGFSEAYDYCKVCGTKDSELPAYDATMARYGWLPLPSHPLCDPHGGGLADWLPTPEQTADFWGTDPNRDRFKLKK